MNNNISSLSWRAGSFFVGKGGGEYKKTIIIIVLIATIKIINIIVMKKTIIIEIDIHWINHNHKKWINLIKVIKY